MQNRVVETERVFTENFIKQQESILLTASALITKSGLVEADKVKELMSYARDLYTNTNDYAIHGKTDPSRNFNKLMVLVDNLKTELADTWHLNGTHPYIPALTSIKQNFINSIQLTQPQYWRSLQNEFKQLDEKRSQFRATNCQSRTEIIKDTCGILACLLWYVPEKIITLGNGCEPCCGPEEACCPEQRAPQAGNNSANLWNLWSPQQSISNFCNDIKDQSKTIDTENTKLIQLPMSRL